jgi:hypothetical protein
MTQLQLIEMVQQIYPNYGETQIRIMLNAALQEIVEETEILSGTDTVTMVSGQRYYLFSAFAGISDSREVLSVTRVDIANEPIKRFIGEISETDIT